MSVLARPIVVRANTGAKPVTYHMPCHEISTISVSINTNVLEVRYLLSVEIVYELLACDTGVEAHLYILLDHEASQDQH